VIVRISDFICGHIRPAMLLINLRRFLRLHRFTRGWTLQELIAPRNLIFFDSTWDSTIGVTKRSRSHLASLLAAITKIDEQTLTDSVTPRSLQSARYCVAQKMSWAAYRTTTREEDMAYCLLGIFGVNMPLLYGEGKKAFIRLQEEIMRSSADLSILAWILPPPLPCADQLSSLVRNATERYTKHLTGVLATSPDCFLHCGNHKTLGDNAAREFAITNVGIKIRTRLYLDCADRVLVLPLNCTTSASGLEIALHLLHLGRQRYLRIDPMSTFAVEPGRLDSDLPAEIYLLIEDVYESGRTDVVPTQVTSRRHLVQIKPSLGRAAVSNPWPASWYDRPDQSFFIGHDRTQDMCTVDVCIHTSDSTALWVTVIALGWADSTTCAQFGIVPAKIHQAALTEVRTLSYRERQGTRAFLQALNYQGIPRMTSFREHLRKTDEAVVITVTSQRQPPDASVCNNYYYTLHLEGIVYRNAEQSPIDAGMDWDTSYQGLALLPYQESNNS
jgi:hypothetical protein